MAAKSTAERSAARIGCTSMVIFWIVPVNVAGARYSSLTGVAESSPTSAPSSAENANGWVRAIRPSPSLVPPTESRPTPPAPGRPPSYAKSKRRTCSPGDSGLLAAIS